MPIFFDGRLIVSPAVASRVDDSAMFNRNPAVGNVLAIVGLADAGEPKTALRFGSASEAAAMLRGGDLLDAIQRAFAGTLETPGPSTIIGVRVQPATRSTLSLLNSASQPVIVLTSQLWGTVANRIQVTISNGTTRGKRIRTRLDQVAYEADNIGRQVLSVRHTGAAASATVTVTATGVTLAAPAGSALPEISFANAPTVAELAERINLNTGWTASVLGGAGNHPTAAMLDFVTAADARSADLILTADLQAIVDWFNDQAEPLVTAVKQAAAGAVPANITGTFMAGATTPAAQALDWSDAFTALQAVDAQWVVPATGDAAIHAMALAHVRFCSDVLRRERRAIVGTALNTSDQDAITAARNLNSDRVGLVHLGVHDFDTAGQLRLYPPFITAAMVAGGFAGVNPGTALTNKALAVRGVERRLRRPTDTDALILGGVMPIEDGPTGYRVVQSVTTWLTNSNFNRREMSVGAALDYVARSIREAMAPLIGTKNGPAALASARARAIATLDTLAQPEPAGIGVIVGDSQNRAWKNLTVSAEGDVLRVQFECSPAIPVNYIPVTIFAAPYSGAVTA